MNEHADATNEAAYVDTHIKDTNEVDLINTVADNATKYSEGDYSKAVLANSEDYRTPKHQDISYHRRKEFIA